MMTIKADFLCPGDYVDFDAIENVFERNNLLDEIEGMGYLINSRGVLGLVETCENCDGDGLNNQNNDRNCRMCDGAGVTIDEGRGKKPHWD